MEKETVYFVEVDGEFKNSYEDMDTAVKNLDFDMKWAAQNGSDNPTGVITKVTRPAGPDAWMYDEDEWTREVVMEK